MAERMETSMEKAHKLVDTDYNGVCAKKNQAAYIRTTKVDGILYECRMPMFPINDLEAWQKHYGPNVTENFIQIAVGKLLSYGADSRFKTAINEGKGHAEAQLRMETYKPGERVGGGGRVADPTTITKKMVARAETDEAYKLASIAALEATLLELKGK